MLLQLGKPEYILFDAVIDGTANKFFFEVTNETIEVQMDQSFVTREGEDSLTFENNMAYDSYWLPPV